MVEGWRDVPPRVEPIRPHEQSLEIDYAFFSNGRSEVRHGSHRPYRYAELFELIERSGFDVALATPWTRDAHSITFIAMRRSR